MGLRYWLKKRLAGEETGDVPPGSSILDTFLGRHPDHPRALGEYDAESYPADVVELLRRRQRVADELLTIDVADPAARQEAIPRLKELLRVYPHALAYEMLIRAYLDAGRWEEARGVAFAAKERRLECARSELPELRAEIDFLHEWDPEEIDQLKQERAGG